MLGLLVTPHQLPPLILPALAVSAVLILIARPAGVMACLLPFRWNAREAAFIAWVGLRGAVPIYLTIIPLLRGVRTGQTLFVVVIVSVAVQGWTIAPAARLLRLRADQPSPDAASSHS
jgi:cell volume regulation protein A